jgi:hypothetical protein
MKHQFSMCFLLAISASLTTFAQEPISKERRTPRSSLFAHLPSKSSCSRLELEKIIHSRPSQTISLKLNDTLVVSGDILDNLITSPGVQNINVRLSNYGNALLHLSILTQAGNTPKIIGRIIHPNNADALIISEENGKYYITKQKMEFFMVE